MKHVEIGLTDKSDSARFAASWLADRGITGQLIAIIGDEIGPVGGVAGSDSLMMIDTLARAPVCSVGLEPEGVGDQVVHLGGGPARFRSFLDTQLARRADRRVPQIDDDPSWVISLPSSHVKSGLRNPSPHSATGMRRREAPARNATAGRRFSL